MANAEVTVGHRNVSRTVTMEIERDLLNRALSGHNPAAMDLLIIKFKDRYRQVHGRGLGYVPRDGLTIVETPKSMAQPHGCGCECAGCDQGYHCSKPSRDCNL